VRQVFFRIPRRLSRSATKLACKHAASIATALAVASAATTAVAQLLTSPDWKFAVVACTIPAIVYVTVGGLLGFGATRTLATFGVGIRFTIAQNSESLAMKPLVPACWRARI
jgi:hypothetical protein